MRWLLIPVLVAACSVALLFGSETVPTRVTSELAGPPETALTKVDPLWAQLADEDPDVALLASLAFAREHVGGLIDVLERGEPQARRFALRALRRLKAPEAFDGLARVARSADLDLALRAVRALEALADPRTAVVFGELLGRRDNRFVKAAAKGLRALGKDALPALSALVAFVESGRAGGRAIMGALESLGPDAAPVVAVLVRALEAGRASVDAGDAVGVIGAVGPKAASAVPVLVRMLVASETHDGEFRTGSPAIGGASSHVIEDALAAIGGPAVEDLVRLLGHPVWGLRYHAKNALAEMDDRVAVPALLHALSRPVARVRAEAVEVLRRFGKRHPELLGTVVALLADPDHGVHPAAVRALGAFGSKATPYLIDALDGQHAVRSAAIEALRDLGSAGRSAVPALAALLAHDESERFDLIHTLGKIGASAAPATDAILAAAVADKSKVIHQLAAESLARIGPAAAEQLVTALGRGAREREIATHALLEMEPATGMSRVLAPLIHDRSLPVRFVAAASLVLDGEGGEHALEIIRETLHTSDLLLRQHALESLEAIPDRAVAVRMLMDSIEDVARQPRRASSASDYILSLRSTAAALAGGDTADFVSFLAHDDEWVRRLAHTALASAKEADLPRLVAATAHRSAVMRRGAAHALAGHPQGLPALRALLADTDLDVRLAAAGSYWRLSQDAGALVPPLLAVLEAGTPKQKKRAGELLRTIGPRAAFAIRELRGALARATHTGTRQALTAVIAAIEDG